MIKTQAFTFDELKFVVKPDAQTIKINDKELDVIHAVATNGKGELWILNNPDFPLICKTKDNSHGMDLSLVNIQ